MPVTEDEQRQYRNMVHDRALELGAFYGPADDLIWHYTTGDALRGIVESRTLFASQVACLNDSTEVRYARRLFLDALHDIYLLATPLSEESSFITFLLTDADKEQGHGGINSDWFVACFSGTRDDLSQWRAYGGGENGYAIGFRSDGLTNKQCMLFPVSYKRDRHAAVAQDLANATVAFFREGLERRSGKARADWSTEFVAEWSRQMSPLAPLVKDPAFASENEYRIVREFSPDDLARLKFRQKRSLMSTHLPLTFESDDGSSLLPIGEVMVGPSRHKDVSQFSVALMLRQHGYAGVPITVSEIPFQTT